MAKKIAKYTETSLLTLNAHIAALSVYMSSRMEQSFSANPVSTTLWRQSRQKPKQIALAESIVVWESQITQRPRQSSR